MANKEVERQVVERLQSVYPAFPPGRITQDESPDFVINGQGSECVGIETTDLVEQVGRHAEQVHEEVVRLARQTYEEQNRPPVLVYMQWRENVRLERRADKAAIAQRLAGLVVSILPEHLPEELTTIESDWDDLTDHRLNEYIFSVRVTCYARRRTNEWFVTEVGYVYSEPQDFQEALSKKETKLAAYREKCPTIWLLIYFLSNTLSGSVEINDEIVRHTYHSSFDRVLVFDSYQARVTELRVGH